MKVVTCDDEKAMGRRAAQHGAEAIKRAIADRGRASIVVATGSSQFEVLAALVGEPEIDWARVAGFHLDEYLGLPATHPASFRRYLKERFVDQVVIGEFHYVDGEADAEQECRRLAQLIGPCAVDVAFIGIGENGHLAFNDPPADFAAEQPYLVVTLDEACRRQQLGEGWFATLDDVPKTAISMSVRQIMRSRTIICSVPDRRKAEAVRAATEGPVTPDVPASILQQHDDVTIYLDRAAASLLTQDDRRES